MRITIDFGSMSIDATRTTRNTGGHDPTLTVTWKGTFRGQPMDVTEFQGILTGTFLGEKVSYDLDDRPQHGPEPIAQVWNFLEDADHVRAMTEPHGEFDGYDPYYGGE